MNASLSTASGLSRAVSVSVRGGRRGVVSIIGSETLSLLVIDLVFTNTTQSTPGLTPRVRDSLFLISWVRGIVIRVGGRLGERLEGR